MRFRHLTLDEQLKKTEKTDEKTVAKAHLLQSKAWKDHIAEHHGAGDKAQLLTVETEEDEESELLQKTIDKKEQAPKEEAPPVVQHTLEHGPNNGVKGSYIGKASPNAPSGAGNYFGTDTPRGKAMISGQCSCGMEISIGWQPAPEQQPSGVAVALQAAYNTQGNTDASGKREDTPLYSTGIAPPNTSGQERPLYNATQPGAAGSLTDQKRRRTSAL